MDKRTNTLNVNIEELQYQIFKEKERTIAIRPRSQSRNGENAQEKMLQKLHNRELHVYRNFPMLYMLKVRLEDLQSSIAQVPPEDIDVHDDAVNNRWDRFATTLLCGIVRFMLVNGSLSVESE